MKGFAATLMLVMLSAAFSVPNASAFEGRWHLSWVTCLPQTANQSFHGPDYYTLILSLSNASQPNLGYDTEIFIGPAVPDAWRFDVAGCQTSNYYEAKRASVGACPSMVGKVPLTYTNYNVRDGYGVLRVATSYETFVPDPSQQYVLSKIIFDHRYSIVGHASNPDTCGGVEQPLVFTAVPVILLATGSNTYATDDPRDAPVRWTGESPVPADLLTWGRVRSLYR